MLFGVGVEDLKRGNDDIKQMEVRAGQNWVRRVCVKWIRLCVCVCRGW